MTVKDIKHNLRLLYLKLVFVLNFRLLEMWTKDNKYDCYFDYFVTLIRM